LYLLAARIEHMGGIGSPTKLPSDPHNSSRTSAASNLFVAATTPRLFLDCDGVLADFESAAERIFAMPTRLAHEKLTPHRFWHTLRNHPNFYGSLPLMPDAMTLFNAVRHLNPIILTGCPVGGWAEPQKHAWAAHHFPGTKIITCMARDKRLHMHSGEILVDDTLKHRHLWEEAGGIFVHHTSAADTLRELSSLGLLP
jgi:hypothetical protein